jgi:hypothetical protein
MSLYRSCLQYFELQKRKKKKKSTKEVKGIKINLDFIFNNFPVYRTGLRLVICKLEALLTFISFV